MHIMSSRTAAVAVVLAFPALFAPLAGATPQGEGVGLAQFEVECDGTIYDAVHAGGGNSAWIDDQHVIHVSATFPGGSVTWGQKTGLGDTHECHPTEDVTIVAADVPAH